MALVSEKKRAYGDESQQLSEFKEGRKSNLSNPIMLLTGHQGEIFTSKFSTSGYQIASGSMDKEIYLWNTFGDCLNYNVLKGHAGAILQIEWFETDKLVSASSDKTVAFWDCNVGSRIRKCKGHTAIVNSCSFQNGIGASASDDSSCKLWDYRSKNPISQLSLSYPLTACSLSSTADVIFVGGVDNSIRALDLKTNTELFQLQGHMETISGLTLSPDGSFLLSASMDNTCAIWDVRPFCKNRLVRTFHGMVSGFEKNLIKPAWSPDQSFVACGSADNTVLVWAAQTSAPLYKLPGHKGCVNQVDFNPIQPIILSCGSDRQIFLGEI